MRQTVDSVDRILGILAAIVIGNLCFAGRSSGTALCSVSDPFGKNGPLHIQQFLTFLE